MKETGPNDSMMDGQPVHSKHAKDAPTTKQDATAGQTPTNPWNSWRRYIAMAEYKRTAMEYAQTGREYVQKYAVSSMKYVLKYGSLATASLLTGGLLMGKAEATTDLSIGYGYSSVLSQRDTLPHPLESTGIAISDPWRQYKNIEHDEFSLSNVERPQPITTAIERLQQNHEFQKEILSACLDPEYATVSKSQMNSIFGSLLQDKDCIKPLSDLCRDPDFRNTFAALVQNKKFMDSIRPLFIGNLQRVVEARQEETRSHNLDTMQGSFKRQKGGSRKLLSLDDDSPDSMKSTRGLELENRELKALIRELKASIREPKCVNQCTMTVFTTFVLTAAGFLVVNYLQQGAKKEAKEAKKQFIELQLQTKDEEIQRLQNENKWYHEQSELKFKQVFDLQKQLQPPPPAMFFGRELPPDPRPLSRDSRQRSISKRSPWRQERSLSSQEYCSEITVSSDE